MAGDWQPETEEAEGGEKLLSLFSLFVLSVFIKKTATLKHA